jgi:hypothetical protein
VGIESEALETPNTGDSPCASRRRRLQGSTRLWETLSGAIPASSWAAVSPNLTKGTLGNRSFINQLAIAPSDTTLAIVGYAAVGGFDQNTPATPGHVFEVACTANCAAFAWTNKSGNLPDIPVDSIVANALFPQQVFAGTD